MSGILNANGFEGMKPALIDEHGAEIRRELVDAGLLAPEQASMK